MEALCRDIAQIREEETLRTNLRRDSFIQVEKSAGETHTQTKCWLYEVIAQKTEGRRMEFYQESGFRPYQNEKLCFKPYCYPPVDRKQISLHLRRECDRFLNKCNY